MRKSRLRDSIREDTEIRTEEKYNWDVRGDYPSDLRDRITRFKEEADIIGIPKRIPDVPSRLDPDFSVWDQPKKSSSPNPRSISPLSYISEESARNPEPMQSVQEQRHGEK